MDELSTTELIVNGGSLKCAADAKSVANEASSRPRDLRRHPAAGPLGLGVTTLAALHTLETVVPNGLASVHGTCRVYLTNLAALRLRDDG